MEKRVNASISLCGNFSGFGDSKETNDRKPLISLGPGPSPLISAKDSNFMYRNYFGDGGAVVLSPRWQVWNNLPFDWFLGTQKHGLALKVGGDFHLGQLTHPYLTPTYLNHPTRARAFGMTAAVDLGYANPNKAYEIVAGFGAGLIENRLSLPLKVQANLLSMPFSSGPKDVIDGSLSISVELGYDLGFQVPFWGLGLKFR